jgi:hypothetical protein
VTTSTTKKKPYKLVSREPLEYEVHEACARALDHLLLPPALWCCYPAGAAQLSPQQQARYSRVGLKRGIPDLLVFYHTVWGIELKRRGGKLSVTRTVHTRRGSPRILVGQDEMFPALLASGAFGAIAIAHSVEEMLDQLTRWGIPLRSYRIGNLSR